MSRTTETLRLGVLALSASAAWASACGKPPKARLPADPTPAVVLGKQPTKRARPAPAMPGQNVPAIKVDTVGYPPGWRKLAIFNVEPKAAVVKNEAGEVVMEIGADQVHARGVDPASKDPVWQVDFSALRDPGRYTLHAEDAASDPFEIGEDVYRQALVLGQKHFYFQRCRSALKPPHANYEGDSYGRESACHSHAGIAWDLADFPERKKKWQLEAGWHDAGNFSMYVPSTAPAAQSLLMAYASNPRAFQDGDLNIPESGNGIPDLLDEVRWGLSWVLSMQDGSGGFRHSETVRGWSERGPADAERKPRWVAGIGTASTAKAASVLALASRVFKPFDATFAERAARASQAAWAFLEKHPQRIMVDLKGSQQPRWDDGPEVQSVAGARLTAAAEVWRTFRIPSARAHAEALLEDPQTQPEEFIKGAWANLARWGLMTLAADEKTPARMRQEARSRIVKAAELLREQIENHDGYRCASKPDDYYWGHNSNLLEKAHVLLVAAQLEPQAAWLIEAARDQWHWILGRNPNGYSMVTRVGKGPERIYHMEWGPAEPPVPGYLIGGPNAVEMKFLSPAAPAKALLWDNPRALRSGLPPHSLWHWEQTDLWDGGFVLEGKWSNGWWAVTEPDIVYNSALVLVAAQMQR